VSPRTFERPSCEVTDYSRM